MTDTINVSEGDVFENELNGDQYIVRDVDGDTVTIESQLAAPNTETGPATKLLDSKYIYKKS